MAVPLEAVLRCDMMHGRQAGARRSREFGCNNFREYVFFLMQSLPRWHLFPFSFSNLLEPHSS